VVHVHGGRSRCGTERSHRFARIQWDTWSPAGWFDEAEFAKTTETFTSNDWADITLNAYRSRWRSGEAWDRRYDALLARLREVESLAVPTLMILGLADNCDPPGESEGLEKYFTSRHLRITPEGVGHFPHRESPDRVAATFLDHLNQQVRS
jgi:pimeloyl-ACP methyl ester carboxylesterase